MTNLWGHSTFGIFVVAIPHHSFIVTLISGTSLRKNSQSCLRMLRRIPNYTSQKKNEGKKTLKYRHPSRLKEQRFIWSCLKFTPNNVSTHLFLMSEADIILLRGWRPLRRRLSGKSVRFPLLSRPQWCVVCQRPSGPRCLCPVYMSRKIRKFRTDKFDT